MYSLLAHAESVCDMRRTSVIDGLVANERVLVAKGWPPISDWWLEHITHLYESKRRRLIVRVGRRGGKSTTMCRVAVAEVMYGDHVIPPGDRGVVAFVSTKLDEAKGRLGTIKELLEALGVPYREGSSEVSVSVMGRERVFRCYAANYRTAVGMTCIGIVADEVARWRDDKSGANPAREVIASMRPAMSTMPHAKIFLISSPLSTRDYHYEEFEGGTNEHTLCIQAPTWVANPTLTEEWTKQEEPDEGTWRREYAAIPMPGGERFFFDERAIGTSVTDVLYEPQPGDELVAGADFAFNRDSSALAVYAFTTRGTFEPVCVHELAPDGAALQPSRVVGTFGGILEQHGVKCVMADGHYKESIREYLTKHDVILLDAPLDVPLTYIRFRALLHGGRVKLPNDRSLVEDMRNITSRTTSSNRVSMQLPRSSGHADLVSAIVLACWQRYGESVHEPPKEPDHAAEARMRSIKRAMASKRRRGI